MDDLKNQIDELIMNYVKQPTWIEETNSIITHINQMQCVSKKDMVNIFNSISNYHWIDYQGLKREKVSRTIWLDTVAIYYGFLMTEIGETIYPHPPGCTFSSFTILKKNTRMQFVHLLHNLWRKIKEKE